MDLDNAQKKKQNGKFQAQRKTHKKGEKISKEEREKRFRDKLCLYCGKPGHVAKDCRAKGQMNAAEEKPTAKRTAEMNMAEPATKGKQAAIPEESSEEETPREQTFDNGKAKYLALTAEALHIGTRYWVYQTCEDSNCPNRDHTGQMRHNHLAYNKDGARRARERIVKLRFCTKEECPNKSTEPGLKHVHQGSDHMDVSANWVLPDPWPATMDMAEPKEDTDALDGLRASEDQAKVEQVFRACQGRGALTPRVDDTVDQHALFGYYSCRKPDSCFLRSIPHIHEQHFDPAEPEKLGMDREEALDAWKEQHKAACNKEECLHSHNHIHWPKNE
jgi:hypothetical protein